MNANTIIGSALRKLLVTPSGGTPTSSELSDGLEALNDLIKLWSANSSLIYQDTLEEITISSGTQSFTIGSTGDYVSGKPVELIAASIKDNDHEYPLGIADVNIYQNFQDKTYSSRPEWIYFRNTVPDSTFYFDSTTNSAYTLVLTSMKELTTFPDGTTEITLPDYYETALKHNLTLALADEFGAGNRVTQTMVLNAQESKDAIIGKSVTINTSPTELTYINGYIGNRRSYNQDHNR